MKEKADRFIAENVKQYGLLGTNIAHNEAKYPHLSGSGNLMFSQDNHFVWGYNGNTFNNRRASTCMYFTDYLHEHKGQIMPLDVELVVAARQWYDTFGEFYVVNRGRLMDYAVVEACRTAGVKFTQLVEMLDGELLFPIDARVNTISVNVTEQNLLDVADSVVPWLRTRSVSVIKDIFLSRVTAERMVFGSGLHLVNHNAVGNESVGPANWALCDAEEDTALLRHDFAYNGPTHVICAGVWSPGMVAAQLNDHGFKAWMAGPGNHAANSFEATLQMWQRVSPMQMKAFKLPDWWWNIQARIDELHDKGKCNEKWFTPLHRLLDRIGVRYPFSVQDESYGTVY